MSQKMESCWHGKTRRGNAMGHLTWEIYAAAFRMGKKHSKAKKNIFLFISENIWVCVGAQGTLDLKSATWAYSYQDLERSELRMVPVTEGREAVGRNTRGQNI